MRDYIQRRYRLALVGLFIGLLLLIAAPAGWIGTSLQIIGAIVVGSALVIAVRTRCPKCHKIFDRRVIEAMVRYSQSPPERCPQCGATLKVRR